MHFGEINNKRQKKVNRKNLFDFWPEEPVCARSESIIISMIMMALKSDTLNGSSTKETPQEKSLTHKRNARRKRKSLKVSLKNNIQMYIWSRIKTQQQENKYAIKVHISCRHLPNAI